METKSFTADWKQRGHISFWRYKPMPRMYSGWHFAGDEQGCDSLRELFKLLLGSDYAAHRTLTVTDPRSVGADHIFGEHELQVLYPKKLRVRFDPEAPDNESMFEESADRLDLALGRAWLTEWQSVLPEVASGEGDFALWFDAQRRLAARDPMKQVWFWWWH